VKNLAVGLVAVLLLIAACGGDEKVNSKAGTPSSTAIPGPTTVPKGALPGWTSEDIKNLNCTASPEKVVLFCTCCYERVTTKYTPSQIEAAKSDYLGGNPNNPTMLDMKSTFDYCWAISK